MKDIQKLKREGALSLTLGIITFIFGITVGTLSIIQGGRLMVKGKKVL
ncbi:MAG: hypothetical protein JXR88_09740 [Clostridia bacterium]|nr:hypothetical protein [Clostridia bacterium]